MDNITNPQSQKIKIGRYIFYNLIYGIYLTIVSFLLQYSPNDCYKKNNNSLWLLINGITVLILGFIIAYNMSLHYMKTKISLKYFLIITGSLLILFNSIWCIFGIYYIPENGDSCLYARFNIYYTPLIWNLTIILTNSYCLYHTIRFTFFVRKSDKCIICFENEPNNFICPICLHQEICTNCQLKITMCPSCRTNFDSYFLGLQDIEQ